MRSVRCSMVLFALCVGGCDRTPVADDASSSDAAAAADAFAAPATDAASSADVGSVAPGIPVLVSARVVTHGTVALAWNLPDSGCDEIVINRNVGGGAYAAVQRLAGAATEAENSPGHGSGTFCYTVSCVMDGVTGDPSNEQCVTQ